MNNEFIRGIAFVVEGATEKVFYRNFLQWLADNNENCSFNKIDNPDIGEIAFEWLSGEESILIKFNVVGTVTQVVHSGKWFTNTCAKKYKIPWQVFLCYDTDSPDKDISKFYEGDWKLLRDELKKSKAKEIIDLAASADIEDVMLVDIESICKYLGITAPKELKGRKGKAKMKALYRSCGNTYHEGDKAENMIKNLDFQKIINEGPIDLKKLENNIKHNM